MTLDHSLLGVYTSFPVRRVQVRLSESGVGASLGSKAGHWRDLLQATENSHPRLRTGNSSDRDTNFAVWEEARYSFKLKSYSTNAPIGQVPTHWESRHLLPFSENTSSPLQEIESLKYRVKRIR